MGTTAARAEERAEAREQRRLELLETAADVVRREGPFVSMEQIAAACGITKPIIYRHFGDRDGLVQAMAERFVGDLLVAVGPAMHQDADPVDLLTSTFDAFLTLLEAEHNLYRFILSQAGSNGMVLAGLISEEVARVIEHHLHQRGLSAAPARPWAYAMVGMAHLAGDWWASTADDATTATLPRAELVQQLTSLVWQGAERLGLGDQPAERPDPRTRPDSPASTTSTSTTSTRKARS